MTAGGRLEGGITKKMREIVLDTETTGLNPATGDRIVEIGCVELVDYIPTGGEFHTYINPQCDMPEEAFAVHGLAAEFLSSQPLFAEIVDDFLAFLDTAPLVIHNAEFDLKFINFELAACRKPAIPESRVIDTLLLARRKFPGALVNLDALCNRFKIDNAMRDKHGALLDSRLLAEVYLELTGGRQQGLGLSGEKRGPVRGTEGKGMVARDDGNTGANGTLPSPYARPPRPHAPSEDELAKHAAMLGLLKKPLWTV